jgi:putative transcriptional regulator
MMEVRRAALSAIWVGSVIGFRSDLHGARLCRPDHFRIRPVLANGDFMATRARLKDDGTVVEVLRDGSERPLVGEVDWSRVDATTEEEIAAQIAQDEAQAMRDAAAYARRVRRRVGLSQVAFARRIGVPVDTVRNWEQGKRAPQGPARALLRIIDRVPEAALQALERA